MLSERGGRSAPGSGTRFMSDPSSSQSLGHRIRSFVRRGGRLTEGQERALRALWPRYGVDITDTPVDWSAVFGRRAPLVLEIGFGNGEATWRMARAEPEHDFIGVEVHPPGVGHLLMALEREAIDNVRVVRADAVEVLSDSIAPASLSQVRIYFPDPWPKKRHHKRRLVQAPFVELLASRIRCGGLLHLATDWADYAEQMLTVLRDHFAFSNLAASDAYIETPDWRPQTKFQRRGERLGHQVFDLLFMRRHENGGTADD